MALTPFTPNTDQKRDALNDVAYEAEQILGILATYDGRSGCFGIRGFAAQNQLQQNIRLEAFLLHIRVLLDFFEHDKRTRRNDQELDDVLSNDYSFSPRPVSIDATLRERLNKDLAHLSYSRTERVGAAKHWQIEKLAVPLLARTREFARHLVGTAVTYGMSSDAQRRWALLLSALDVMHLGADA